MSASATSGDCRYGKPLLRASGVSVALGGRPILRDVNLEVCDLIRPGRTQGQVVGLLGPSGMGKTTLFRILAGLDAPDHGSVLLGDEGRPVERGMVGVVAQNYPLFEHRTVLGNLLVAGHTARLPSREVRPRAREMLRRFDLAEHGSKYPAQLSGGQRQRVAIAQQFMCSEHFLLMDEPFSGLDLIAEENVIRLIREVAQQDELNTMILVTHDVTAALQVSDHLWLLGRDRDPSGDIIPGARVQATFDLVERRLAWREGIASSQEFLACRDEIRQAFMKL